MNPNDIVVTIADALQAAGIPFMIVGSFSSNIYGVDRATKDADIVLQLDPHSMGDLMSRLGPEFKLDQQLAFETVTMTSKYVMAHLHPYFKIELFLLSDDAHDQERFRRRVPRSLGNHALFFPSPEDVIVTKLRWSKGGRRNKDVDDVPQRPGGAAGQAGLGLHPPVDRPARHPRPLRAAPRRDTHHSVAARRAAQNRAAGLPPRYNPALQHRAAPPAERGVGLRRFARVPLWLPFVSTHPMSSPVSSAR